MTDNLFWVDLKINALQQAIAAKFRFYYKANLNELINYYPP